MTEQSFALIPFPASNIPEIHVTGNISRQGNLLSLHYCLAGSIENIHLPQRSVHPNRKDELWKSTCFEFFLGIKGQPSYWEFNMSPSGDWNVYRMDAYRRIGFREETSVQRLQFEVLREAGVLALNAAVDLTDILDQHQSLEAAVTAIIQSNEGYETYWALTHPASQADFHLRESFALVLAGQTRPAPQSVPES